MAKKRSKQRKRADDRAKKTEGQKEEKRKVRAFEPYRNIRWLDARGKQCYIAVPRELPGRVVVCSGQWPDSNKSSVIYTIHKSFAVASEVEMRRVANRYCAESGFKKTKLTKKEKENVQE